MNRYSIVDIAKVIDEAMRKYVEEHPDDIDSGYNAACLDGLKAGLKLGKGIFNPKTIENMVYMNRSAFDGSKYILPC